MFNAIQNAMQANPDAIAIALGRLLQHHRCRPLGPTTSGQRRR
ncbi:MAG: hypothetical protein WKG07_36095 [Hymenobacter sp.]